MTGYMFEPLDCSLGEVSSFLLLFAFFFLVFRMTLGGDTKIIVANNY